MAPDDGIVGDTAETTPAVTTNTATDPLEHWGGYRLVRRLGAGSFGSVYSAWDAQLERNIAIKILHERVADGRTVQHLLREGRALARVQHANVVQVFGIEAHGSRVGLCMELVAGETLADRLRSHGLLNHREATVVGEDVCRALAAVHAAGYLHRDVKAQNVMRDKSGKTVLMDFGTGHDTGRDGRPQDAAGTPVYMAPEVLAGQPASAQSDIYALGVLLYYLVTGQYPVEGGSVVDLINAHRAGRGLRLLDRRPDLPMAFVQVVSRALAPNPAERWPSAGAMLEALGGLRNETIKPEASTWARLVVRVAAAVAGGALGLTALGMVNSRYFNVVLGREAFAAEGMRDWLYWGAVSAVAPVVLALMVLVGLSLLTVVLRTLSRLWPRLRRQVEALPKAARRLGLDDVESVSACMLVASTGVLGAACWLVLPDLEILMSLIDPNIATGPVERLAYLSPAASERRATYRQSFAWACIIMVALWSVPYRMSARRGHHVNNGIKSAGAAVLLLTVLLMDLPYRLMYQAKFDAVQWRGLRCYVIGERRDEWLLYCPDLAPPRNRIVKNDASELEPIGTKVTPFDHPAVFPTEQP